MKKMHLNSGYEMPVPAFGTAAIGGWQIDGKVVTDAVASAFAAGYRHIDTASVYGNERGVGAAIRESGVSRSDLFITTKVWNSEQGYSETKQALERSLNRLRLEYVDLYLIHWPVPAKIQETWRALEELRSSGFVRNIGLSNFREPDIELILENCSVRPVCNQIECHPYFQQRELCTYLQEREIAVVGWSPLGTGAWSGIAPEQKPLADPVLGKIAEKHRVSVAQVTLRWCMQRGIVPIPKSENPERIAQNIMLYDFELGAEEMEKIASLDKKVRLGGNPNDVEGLSGVRVPD